MHGQPKSITAAANRIWLKYWKLMKCLCQTQAPAKMILQRIVRSKMIAIYLVSDLIAIRNLTKTLIHHLAYLMTTGTNLNSNLRKWVEPQNCAMMQTYSTK